MIPFRTDFEMETLASPLTAPEGAGLVAVETPTDREKGRVAYHEAGHAVAAWSLGCPFSTVTIVPDERGEGCVSLEGFRKRLTHSGHNPKLAQQWGAIQLSGPVAAKKYVSDPEDDEFQQKDHEALLLIVLGESFGPADQIAREVSKARNKAQQLVKANWDRITLLAEALLERGSVDPADAIQIIESVGMPPTS